MADYRCETILFMEDFLWRVVNRHFFLVGLSTPRLPSQPAIHNFRSYLALANVWDWCKKNRHESMVQQHRQLSAKVRGHYAYYGIRGNSRALGRFLTGVRRAWHYWLNHRSRERNDGARLWKLLDEHFPLPPVHLVHTETALQPSWSL